MPPKGDDSKMRAVVVADARVEVANLPDPTPGDGEVVIAVERCGICGTDLRLPENPRVQGLVPGHEIAGRIVDIAPHVAGLRLGTLVAVKPSDPCGYCGPCRREEPNSCPNQWPTHIGLARNGGYAEYLSAPSRNVVVVPDGLTAADAALAEPFAVALHGISLAPTPAGTTAAVIGAGPLGLLITVALLTRGVDVTVVEPRPARAAAARSVGATFVHSSTLELEEGSYGATSLVLECSGAAGMAAEAVRLVRTGGSVILMATTSQPLTLESGSWLRKEVAVRPSIGYSMTDFKAGMQAVAAGIVSPALLSTEERPLEEAQASFDALRDGEAVKIQLNPTASTGAAAPRLEDEAVLP
jgi:2-desacetyl-2-hydroxyethyl bacteriochlorophyllide A dehydrogenase